jgi:hypothetical protein
MAKTLKTSAPGRKCMFPHCTQILSIYNHESYCHVHLDRTNKLLPKQLRGPAESEVLPDPAAVS